MNEKEFKEELQRAVMHKIKEVKFQEYLRVDGTLWKYDEGLQEYVICKTKREFEIEEEEKETEERKIKEKEEERERYINYQIESLQTDLEILFRGFFAPLFFVLLFVCFFSFIVNALIFN